MGLGASMCAVSRNLGSSQLHSLVDLDSGSVLWLMSQRLFTPSYIVQYVQILQAICIMGLLHTRTTHFSGTVHIAILAFTQ